MKKTFMAISWTNELKVKGDMPCDNFGIKNGSELKLVLRAGCTFVTFVAAAFKLVQCTLAIASAHNQILPRG